MRVLITGSAGFIGSHLAESFEEAGHDVQGVDIFLTGSLSNWPKTLHVDIVDRHALYEVTNAFRPELIVHCAASYSDPQKWHRDTETNTLGTINCCISAIHHSARLFYFQTALPPISSYAASKIAGEQYISISGVRHLIFRLANIYGPRNLSGPIPTFYRRMIAGEKCITVDTRRDMVFIDDLVDAVRGAAEMPLLSGKYDIASGCERSIYDLHQSVAAAMGRTDQPDRLPRPEDDVETMSMNPLPAGRDLGFDARTDFDEGVARAVYWYAQNGVSDTYTHLKLKG